MSKIFNYEKQGRGISKSVGNKKYSVSNFFRIYKEKFFKLLGLNLIYCVAVVAILALVWIPLNKVTTNKSLLIDNMQQSGYNSVYTTAVERMVSAYNISDDELNNAWTDFCKATQIVAEVNEAALSENITDGKVVGFDSALYTDEQMAEIGAYLISGFEKIGFTVNISGENGIYYYELFDAGVNSVAKLTYVENSSMSDAITFEHRFPLPVKTYGLILLCFLPLVLLGPLNLCMSRITRDYIREEPSFMFSDMWDTFKKNWWQSLVISFIQYISITCAAIAMIWYYSFINSGFLFIVGFAACMFMLYMFLSMHFYVPLMQVTLNLNLRKIYKNALYFTIIGMFKNILLIIIGVALAVFIAAMFIFGVSSDSTSIVISLTVTFILVCLFSLWFYLISCFAYPSIQKYVIDPYYAEQNKSEEDSDDGNQEVISEESDTFYNQDDEDNDTQNIPEYIYHNGRMVHRSVVEQETLFEDDIGTNDK